MIKKWQYGEKWKRNARHSMKVRRGHAAIETIVVIRNGVAIFQEPHNVYRAPPS